MYDNENIDEELENRGIRKCRGEWNTYILRGDALGVGFLCRIVGVLVDTDHVIWYLFQDLFSDGRFLHTPLLYGACSVLVAYTVCFAVLFIKMAANRSSRRKLSRRARVINSPARKRAYSHAGVA